MPTNEKEYNGNLFDQLSIIERIERHLKSVDEPGTLFYSEIPVRCSDTMHGNRGNKEDKA